MINYISMQKIVKVCDESVSYHKAKDYRIQ